MYTLVHQILRPLYDCSVSSLPFLPLPRYSATGMTSDEPSIFKTDPSIYQHEGGLLLGSDDARLSFEDRFGWLCVALVKSPQKKLGLC